MALAFRAENQVVTVGATTLTPADPTNAALGDVLLAGAIFVGDPGTVTTPGGGWQVVFDSGYVNTRGMVWALVRGSGAPSYAWTWANSIGASVGVSAWSGAEVIGNQPYFEGYSGTAEESTWDPPARQPNTINTLAIGMIMDQVGAGAGGWTAPSGYTLAQGGAVTNQIGAAYKALTTQAAENPGVFANGTAFRDYAVSFILRAAQTAPPIRRISRR